MATLKDVANLAHCDVSTVSRALNNTSYVHPDTKARILAAVKELSYHPNILAKGLRQGKRHTIGVVVPRLSMSIFSDVTQGVVEVARKREYETLISYTNEDAAMEKEVLNRLRNGFADALILAGTGHNKRLIRDIHADGLPVIQVVRQQDNMISSVTVDNRMVGYEATKYMAQAGCRRIGLINGSMKIGPYRSRLGGYEQALRELGLEAFTVEAEGIEHGIRYGYECANKLLDQTSRLDGILAASDAQGIGVMRALKENGLRVPDDVKVISLTGYALCSMLETSLTSIELPGFEIGQKAAEMAIDEIDADEKKKKTVRHLILSAALVKRESC